MYCEKRASNLLGRSSEGTKFHLNRRCEAKLCFPVPACSLTHRHHKESLNLVFTLVDFLNVLKDIIVMIKLLDASHNIELSRTETHQDSADKAVIDEATA